MLKGKNQMSLTEQMIEIPAEHEANVFGQFDAYVKKTGADISCHSDCAGRKNKNCRRAGGRGKSFSYPDTACGIVQAGQYYYRTECRLCDFAGI